MIETPQARLEQFTSQLRQARRARGITQEELAAGLGVRASTVINWEWGREAPTVGNLLRWSEALGFTLAVTGAPAGVSAVPRPGEPFDEYHLRALVLRLVAARVRADWTQEMVGDRLAVTLWSVHMWETHRRVPRLLRLIGWCHALGCDLELIVVQYGKPVRAPGP